MLFSKESLHTEKEEDSEKDDNKELIEQDYIQINKDISQALLEMKKQKEIEKESNSNDSSEQNGEELVNFDKDIFSDSSYNFSYSLDNNSDFSEKSYRSANIKMNRNNLGLESLNKINQKNNNNSSLDKNDVDKNKDKKNSQNNLSNNQVNEVLSFKDKNSSNVSTEGYSYIDQKKAFKTFDKKSSFKSTNDEGTISGFYFKGDNLNNSFNSSSYLNVNNNTINKKICQNNPLFNDNFIKNNNVNNINISDNNNLSNNINNCINFNEKIHVLMSNNFNNINNIHFIKKNKEENFYMQNNNPNNSYIRDANCILSKNNMLNNNMNIINCNNMNYINCNNNNIYNNNNININHNYNIMMINPSNTINNITNNQNVFNIPNPDGNISSFINKNEIKDSPRNIIYIENVLKNKDKRTTLIIRNIPNRYTISLLLQEINRNYYRKYDVVYLPQDYINNTNLGFGFINFLDHMYLIMFYEEFIGKKWNCFNSQKRCLLAYSKYQGKNELIKYIHKKMGINNHSNNNENSKKSLFINNYNKYPRPLIEIPLKYYKSFISYYPFSLCHIKDEQVFVVDNY